MPAHTQTLEESILQAIKRHGAQKAVRYVIGTFPDEGEQKRAQESDHITLTTDRLIISSFPERCSFEEWLAELEHKRAEKEKAETEQRAKARLEFSKQVKEQLQRLRSGQF